LSYCNDQGKQPELIKLRYFYIASSYDLSRSLTYLSGLLRNVGFFLMANHFEVVRTGKQLRMHRISGWLNIWRDHPALFIYGIRPDTGFDLPDTVY
jgi:hypothetical protein